jgi:hypothetical protein
VWFDRFLAPVKRVNVPTASDSCSARARFAVSRSAHGCITSILKEMVMLLVVGCVWHTITNARAMVSVLPVNDWDLMEATVSFAYNQLKIRSRDHPLLLVDSAIANNMQPQREKFVEMLFERFNVPALYLARSAVLSACVLLLLTRRASQFQAFFCRFSAGRSTAVVVDVGASSTRVCPVFEGYLLQKGAGSSRVASSFVWTCELGGCVQHLIHRPLEGIAWTLSC